MNVGEINSRVWDRLGEDSSDPGRYTAAIILEFIKEAVEMWSIAVGGMVKTQQITLTDDTLEYTLSEAPVRLISAQYDGVNFDKWLIPTTEFELYETQGFGKSRRWRNVRADRPRYYVWHNPTKIWFWPPMSTAGSNTVTVTYQEFIDDDVDGGDTDIPSLPKEFHRNIVDYVHGRCLLLGSGDADRITRATNLIKKFMDALNTARERKTSGHYMPVIHGGSTGVLK